MTREEAQGLLDAWYADRPEVKQWQQRVIEEAKRTGNTRTLMGRYRKLPEINSRDRGKQGHSARAAINTPIQGGAADVVMLAMVKINNSPLLEKLGFKVRRGHARAALCVVGLVALLGKSHDPPPRGSTSSPAARRRHGSMTPAAACSATP